MASDTPLQGGTPEQKSVEERLSRVKEIRDLHARGTISEAEMTNTLLQIRLERTQDLHTRGIISEDEMTNILVDDLLGLERIGPDTVAVFIAAVPGKVQDTLKTWLASGPRTEAEWEKVPVVIFDGDEQARRRLRLRKCRNADSLRQHFGLNS
jgi:hypothetical protein